MACEGGVAYFFEKLNQKIQNARHPVPGQAITFARSHWSARGSDAHVCARRREGGDLLCFRPGFETDFPALGSPPASRISALTLRSGLGPLSVFVFNAVRDPFARESTL